MDTVGPRELLIMLAIGLLFGANRRPQLARSLGDGIGEFRSPMSAANPAALLGPRSPGPAPRPKR